MATPAEPDGAIAGRRWQDNQPALDRPIVQVRPIIIHIEGSEGGSGQSITTRFAAFTESRRFC